VTQRFGGQFSPTGNAAQEISARPALPRAKVNPVGARANLMFLPPIPLVFLSFGQGAIGLTLGVIAAGSLTLGAWLLRDGLRAEAAYHARKIARRPALPRKLGAALYAGIGIGLAAFKVETGLIAPVLFAGLTVALHIAAFGIDPMANKGMEDLDTFQQDRVARVVDEAESHLSAMTNAIRRASDQHMARKLEQFQEIARALIRTVEEDPRDLTAARKYLGIYLLGARDATSKFADIYSRTQDHQARMDYGQLLDDLSSGFAQKTQKLLTDDRSDLTVEIDVLRDRLQREGVHITSQDP